MISRQTSGTQQEPQLQTVDANCPKHGDYQARVIDMSLLDRPNLVGGCPVCAAERQAAEDARKARDIAIERQNRVSTLLHRSGIPVRFADRTFDGYAATTQGQKIALGVCRAYAEKWPDKYETGASLVLTGGPGTGKTHLACAIASSVTEAHMASSLFITVSAMLRSIKETYRKGSERSEQAAIDAFKTPHLLIVDEVGVQIGSDHEKLLMFEVLNERYQWTLPTILISNLSIGELEDFLGQRIMDRYRECGSVLAFDWQSHRGVR